MDISQKMLAKFSYVSQVTSLPEVDNTQIRTEETSDLFHKNTRFNNIFSTHGKTEADYVDVETAIFQFHFRGITKEYIRHNMNEGIHKLGEIGVLRFRKAGQSTKLTHLYIYDSESQIHSRWQNEITNKPFSYNLGVILLSLRMAGHTSIFMDILQATEGLEDYITSVPNFVMQNIPDQRRKFVIRDKLILQLLAGC